MVAAPSGPRTERVSVRASSSQWARSKISGSRSSQRPCVSAMSSGLGSKTSKIEASAGDEGLAGSLECFDALAVVREVEVGTERADDERNLFVERRMAKVAEP